MQSDSDIYSEIAAGGSHVGELFDELVHLGRSAEEIQRGVAKARAEHYASNVTPLVEQHGCGGMPTLAGTTT